MVLIGLMLCLGAVRGELIGLMLGVGLGEIGGFLLLSIGLGLLKAVVHVRMLVGCVVLVCI